MNLLNLLLSVRVYVNGSLIVLAGEFQQTHIFPDAANHLKIPAALEVNVVINRESISQPCHLYYEGIVPLHLPQNVPQKQSSRH